MLVSHKVMDWVLSDLCHAALAGLLQWQHSFQSESCAAIG